MTLFQIRCCFLLFYLMSSSSLFSQVFYLLKSFCYISRRQTDDLNEGNRWGDGTFNEKAELV